MSVTGGSLIASTLLQENGQFQRRPHVILNEELTEKIEETKQKLWCIACSIYYMWEKKQYITRRCKRVQDKLQQAETFDGEQSLPPTKDALIQHVKRCTNQAAIHSRALQQRIDALSPEGHGWKLENDDFITWMTKPPDPDVLLQCVSSSCRVGKCLKGRCS
ncbi:uncharacterized protein [Apostichopus japonicus]|uniref:uncharacterized protein n=1 Tax=Stichopus japonicus TaxID=307972 RepID=UPI003AB8D594